MKSKVLLFLQQMLYMKRNYWKIKCWAKFWAIFSQNHQVTLLVSGKTAKANF
jgi:hypothetical protein